MQLNSKSITDNEVIPAKYAFGKADAHSNIALSNNISPHLAWSDAPVGTQSFVVICHDSDVPSKPDDVNQTDREIPAELPRVNFYHWLLLDIPAATHELAEGDFSKEVTPKGKSGPGAAKGLRHGLNDYTSWFANDHDMSGDYFGYDGPCPPFNDSIIHHYHFTVYALSVDKVPLEGKFGGDDLVNAIAPYVLDKTSIVGTYTTNPRLLK